MKESDQKQDEFGEFGENFVVTGNHQYFSWKDKMNLEIRSEQLFCLPKAHLNLDFKNQKSFCSKSATTPLWTMTLKSTGL